MSLAENMVIARPVFLVHESHRTDVKLLLDGPEWKPSAATRFVDV